MNRLCTGFMLLFYIIYKPTQLWDSWTTGGPGKCRYIIEHHLGGLTKAYLKDWNTTVVIPHFRRMKGNKLTRGTSLLGLP